jgi:hypothetical protein
MAETLTSRLSAALTTLRWGAPALAREAGINDRTVRRWLQGVNAPPEHIVLWVEGLAECYKAYPRIPGGKQQ